MKAQATQERMREIAAANPEALPAMLQEAVASGADPATINAISTAIRATTESDATAAGVGSKAKGLVVDVGGRKELIDPTTGETLRDLGEPPPPRGVVVDTAEGKVLVDPTTGARIAVYEPPSKPVSQYQSEAESRLGQFRIARENIVSGLEATGRGPTWAEWKLYNSDLPGRKAISSEMQGLLQAQNLIVTQIAKELGGVRGAASPEFRNVIARTYLVAPGDQPLNIEQTLEALEAMERDLERKAGGAFDMSPTEIARTIEAEPEGPEEPEIILNTDGLPDPSEY
jgi:hypothetical protein